jgi:hypothetical protein
MNPFTLPTEATEDCRITRKISSIKRSFRLKNPDSHISEDNFLKFRTEINSGLSILPLNSALQYKNVLKNVPSQFTNPAQFFTSNPCCQRFNANCEVIPKTLYNDCFTHENLLNTTMLDGLKNYRTRQNEKSISKKKNLKRVPLLQSKQEQFHLFKNFIKLKDPPSKLISPKLLNINELHAFCKPLTEEFQSNHVLYLQGGIPPQLPVDRTSLKSGQGVCINGIKEEIKDPLLLESLDQNAIFRNNEHIQAIQLSNLLLKRNNKQRTIGCAKEKTPFISFTQLPNRSKHKKLSFRSQDCDSALLYGFCRRPTVDEPPETSYLPLEKEFSKETITGHSKILSLATDFKEVGLLSKLWYNFF